MVRVWTNGCFDLLHRGHIELFNYAKSVGNWLRVGLDSDEMVRKAKGVGRPLNTLEDRKFLVNSIGVVDEVCGFNSHDELIELLKDYKPDIMIVGGDWEGKSIVGGVHTKEIKYFKRIEEYSTSKLANA
tara:strand:- start:228 stop:614 length:387 start_codon:yes stop_codon:yes gene_type:complete